MNTSIKDRGIPALEEKRGGMMIVIAIAAAIIGGVSVWVYATSKISLATSNASPANLQFGVVQEVPYVKTRTETVKEVLVEDKKIVAPQVQINTGANRISELSTELASLKTKAQQEREAQMIERRSKPGLVFDESESLAATNLQVADLNDPNALYDEVTNGAMVTPVDAKYIPNTNEVILQGKTIPTYLETAIQSDLAGYIRAVVSDDVYSYDGSTLLIPRGSRAIGEYASGIVTGQTRLFTTWSRIITPDGFSILVDSQGTDAIGRVGSTGEVVTHFWKRFGTSMLLSIIGAVAADQVKSSDNNADDEVVDDFEKQAEIALRHNLNIPPTINIAQGTPINIFVRHDLDFSSALALLRE